jgi:DNA polymerase III delta prime subunit
MIYDELKNDWDLGKFAANYIIVTQEPLSSLSTIERFVKDNILTNSTLDLQNNPDYLLVRKEFVNNKEQKYITISQVRSVIDFFSKTSWGNAKLSIIYEADYLNENASNGLLKILEDTPVRSYIFLIVSNLNQLIATIRSRSRILYDTKLKSSKVISYNYLNLLLNYSEKEIEKFLKVLEQEGGATIWQDFSSEIAFALRNIILYYSEVAMVLSVEERRLLELTKKNTAEEFIKLSDKLKFYSSSCLKYDLSKRHIFYLIAEIIR